LEEQQKDHSHSSNVRDYLIVYWSHCSVFCIDIIAPSDINPILH
jgi:hypothetical protein